jgi:hypothetical protein
LYCYNGRSFATGGVQGMFSGRLRVSLQSYLKSR